MVVVVVDVAAGLAERGPVRGCTVGGGDGGGGGGVVW